MAGPGFKQFTVELPTLDANGNPTEFGIISNWMWNHSFGTGWNFQGLHKLVLAAQLAQCWQVLASPATLAGDIVYSQDEGDMIIL